MNTIWNTIKKIKTNPKTSDIQKELSDEIKQIRERNKAFNATNETDTYVVLVFSCKKDRDEFMQNVHIKKDTYIDGYEFCRLIGSSPTKPSIKLPKPLNK